ncbi:hypothetical protein EJB05_07423, partial [Eragrostis curvula]
MFKLLGPFGLRENFPKQLASANESEKRTEHVLKVENKGEGTSNQVMGNIFEGMLKALVMDNNQIKEATKFALDNSDSAGVIVEILTKSLTLKETPVRLKIARLLLVSNILYSRDPTYHNKFKSILPRVMFTFNELCCTIRENLVVGIVKERVLKVLQDWANWSLYSNEYFNILRDIFLGSGETRIVDATATNNNNNIDGGENLLGTEPTKAVDSIDNKAECNDANGGSQLTPHGETWRGAAFTPAISLLYAGKYVIV